MRRADDELARVGYFFLLIGMIALLTGAGHAAGAVWMNPKDESRYCMLVDGKRIEGYHKIKTDIHL